MLNHNWNISKKSPIKEEKCKSNTKIKKMAARQE